MRFTISVLAPSVLTENKNLFLHMKEWSENYKVGFAFMFGLYDVIWQFPRNAKTSKGYY